MRYILGLLHQKVRMKRALLWVFLLPLFACKDKDGDDTGVATDGLLVGSELDGALYSVWGTSARFGRRGCTTCDMAARLPYRPGLPSELEYSSSSSSS